MEPELDISVRHLSSSADDRLKITEPVKRGDPLVLWWDIGPQYQYTMEVTYLQKTEQVQFKLDTRNNGWLALGFGSSMFNSDMLAWHSADDKSY